MCKSSGCNDAQLITIADLLSLRNTKNITLKFSNDIDDMEEDSMEEYSLEDDKKARCVLSASGLLALSTLEFKHLALTGIAIGEAEASALTAGRSPVSLTQITDNFTIDLDSNSDGQTRFNIPAICGVPLLTCLKLEKLSDEDSALVSAQRVSFPLHINCTTTTGFVRLLSSPTLLSLEIDEDILEYNDVSDTAAQSLLMANAVAQNKVLQSLHFHQNFDYETGKIICQNTMLTSLDIGITDRRSLHDLIRMTALRTLTVMLQFAGDAKNHDLDALRAFAATPREQIKLSFSGYHTQESDLAIIVSAHVPDLTLHGVKFGASVMKALLENRHLLSLTLRAELDHNSSVRLAQHPTLIKLNMSMYLKTSGSLDDIKQAWHDAGKIPDNLILTR